METRNAEDYGDLFQTYSDIYKSDVGIRPRLDISAEEAREYLDRRSACFAASDAVKAAWPKGTLVNIMGVLARVVGYETDDNQDEPFHFYAMQNEGLKVRSIVSGETWVSCPSICKKVKV